MISALVALTLAVAAVLGWSGVAKLREPGSMGAALHALKVPKALTGRPVQLGVPWVEVGLAAALLVLGGAWQSLAWAGALLLFAVYLLLIAAAVGREEEVSCNCFGAGSAPVGRQTLTRNGLLVAASALGLFGSVFVQAPLIVRLARLGWSGWLGLLSVAVVAGLAWTLSREQSPVAATAAATPAGADAVDEPAEDYVRMPIPAAVVERGPGEFLLLRDLCRERGAVLVYVSVTCASCTVVLGRIDDYVRRLPELDIVLVVGARDAIDQLPDSVRSRAVVEVANSLVAGLELPWVPAAVLLGADGLLAGGPVFGEGDIDQMVNDVVEQFAGSAEDEESVAPQDEQQPVRSA